jgi:eukaryotic-like serine/threonine-protein kinase
LTAEHPAVPDYQLVLGSCLQDLGQVLTDQKKWADAEEPLRGAVAVMRKLTDTSPAVTRYREDLGRACLNDARLFRETGRPEEALDWFEKSRSELDTVLRTDSRLPFVRRDLRLGMEERAALLEELDRLAEAVPCWGRAAKLADEKDKPRYRLVWASGLARTGRPDQALAEVRQAITTGSVVKSITWLVCADAFAAAAAGGADAGRKREYADLAVELVRKAVAGGYRDTDFLRSGDNMAVLRDRDDFKQLVAELEMRFPLPWPQAPAPRPK